MTDSLEWTIEPMRSKRYYQRKLVLLQAQYRNKKVRSDIDERVFGENVRELADLVKAAQD